jgi:hypothetical protein
VQQALQYLHQKEVWGYCLMPSEALAPELRTVAARSRLSVFIERASRNPRWMLMDSLSRFVLVRTVARLLRSKPASDSGGTNALSAFTGIDVSSFVAALERDGFGVGLQLPAHYIQAILRFVDKGYCYGDADARMGFRYRDKVRAEQKAGRVFSQATYFFPDELRPTLENLAADPLLTDIASRYMQAPAALTGYRLWWTFAASEAEYNASLTTSFFHYDKDDYAGLRLFFYLTEVDSDHGPHVVVRGSHKNKKLTQLFSLGQRSDAEIVGHYGIKQFETIYGKPGTGFAEDPFCFHKATRPRSGDRLVLEVKYALRDYRIFPDPDRSTVRILLDDATGPAD